MIVIVPSLALTLTGCPVTFNMMLKNETETDLSVTYVSGYTTRIGPGDVKKERYNVDCITIVSEGIPRQFRADWPPDEFIENGAFSSTIYAVFTKEQRLVLVQAGDQAAELELEQGCD